MLYSVNSCKRFSFLLMTKKITKISMPPLIQGKEPTDNNAGVSELLNALCNFKSLVFIEASFQGVLYPDMYNPQWRSIQMLFQV